MSEQNNTRKGDVMKLRIWWIPQIPGNPMYIPVEDLKQAKLLLDSLAYYDMFQLENNIKPDYSNAGGLQEWCEEEKEWYDWECDDGFDFDEYCEEENICYYGEIQAANKRG